MKSDFASCLDRIEKEEAADGRRGGLPRIDRVQVAEAVARWEAALEKVANDPDHGEDPAAIWTRSVIRRAGARLARLARMIPELLDAIDRSAIRERPVVTAKTSVCSAHATAHTLGLVLAGPLSPRLDQPREEIGVGKYSYRCRWSGFDVQETRNGWLVHTWSLLKYHRTGVRWFVPFCPEAPRGVDLNSLTKPTARLPGGARVAHDLAMLFIGEHALTVIDEGTFNGDPPLDKPINFCSLG